MKKKFNQSANRFIQNEAHFPNDYLLEKAIDPRQKTIVLTYGGKKITAEEIEQLNEKLAYYRLEKTSLTIRQGFEYLNEIKQLTTEESPLKQILAEKEGELAALRAVLDSLDTKETSTIQLIDEIKVLYPDFKNIALTTLRSADTLNSTNTASHLVYLQFSKPVKSIEQKRIQNWLETKLHLPLKVVFEP